MLIHHSFGFPDIFLKGGSWDHKDPPGSAPDLETSITGSTGDTLNIKMVENQVKAPKPFSANYVIVSDNKLLTCKILLQ